jgi:uncharacterized protein YggE
MRNALLTVTSCWVALATLEPGEVRAQLPTNGTIAGQGQVELKRQPHTLRVYVDVMAKGKSLREALDKLRDQRQSARRNLELFGAAPDSIKFGDPTIETERNDRRFQQMMMMQAMANPAGNKNAPKAKEAPSILVSCSLKAEFPLKPASPEELLLAAHALEERIKGADLGGTKGLKQASAQDEELAQEQAGMFGDPSGNENHKPGEPAFTYVCKISAEERARALASAFALAKSEAALLARAAGVQLERLSSLFDASSPTYTNPGEEEGMVMRGGRAYFIDRMTGQIRISDPDDVHHEPEAIGSQPNKVRFRITLTASFDVKK